MLSLNLQVIPQPHPGGADRGAGERPTVVSRHFCLLLRDIRYLFQRPAQDDALVCSPPEQRSQERLAELSPHPTQQVCAAGKAALGLWGNLISCTGTCSLVLFVSRMFELIVNAQ